MKLLTILICKPSNKIKTSNKRRIIQSIQGKEIPINIVLDVNNELHKNGRNQHYYQLRNKYRQYKVS